MDTADLVPVAERAQAPARLPVPPPDTGLTWRALTPDDVPAWLALLQTVEDHDDAAERTSRSELAELFDGEWRDPARDLLGGFDPAGRLRAYARAEFQPVDAGTLAPVLLGAVHPDDRGRGLGRALAAWAEGRARQQLAGVDSRLPARLRWYVDDHHTDARSLATRAGFTPQRWYLDLRRDLAQPLPEVTLDDGLAIEGYRDERSEEIRVTHNESFAVDHWGSSPIRPDVWAQEVVGRDTFRAGWSFAAVDTGTGRVVGYLISAAYEQDWEPQGYTEGWTDLVAVRREYRGRGLASALLAAAMRAYAGAGLEYAGLGVDTENPTGALGLYTRLGYVRERSSVLYTKELT